MLGRSADCGNQRVKLRHYRATVPGPGASSSVKSAPAWTNTGTVLTNTDLRGRNPLVVAGGPASLEVREEEVMNNSRSARVVAKMETVLRELVVANSKRDKGAINYKPEAYQAAMDRAQQVFAELREVRRSGELPPYKTILY